LKVCLLFKLEDLPFKVLQCWPVCQKLPRLYELNFWALRGLWTRPGQSEVREQVLWDTLYIKRQNVVI
jgi:hypothetical protein